MAIWPLNRRQNESSTSLNVPAEVSQYYQAEQRNRTGLAWLLAAGTLVVTIMVALGLFFGGRWLYRKAHNDNASRQPASQTVKSKDTAKPATGAPQTSGSGSSNSTSNGSPNSSSATPPSTNQSAPLPRTGPDEDL